MATPPRMTAPRILTDEAKMVPIRLTQVRDMMAEWSAGTQLSIMPWQFWRGFDPLVVVAVYW